MTQTTRLGGKYQGFKCDGGASGRVCDTLEVEIPVWDHESSVLYAAAAAKGWVRQNGKDFCPKCVSAMHALAGATRKI